MLLLLFSNIKRILVLLLLLLSVGCQPYYIRTDQVNALSVGNSPAQVKSILEKDPDKILSKSVAGSEYTIQVNQMLTDQITMMTMACDQYGCTPIPYTEPVTEPYLIVLKNSKVVFWGFVEELNKANDAALNEVGGYVAAKLTKE
jgi:hypothetical protein